MTKITEHFSEEAMSCKCHRLDCDAVSMNMQFMEMLESLRVHWGKPLLPTSGSRCVYHNSRQKNASPRSMHLIGRAVDLWFNRVREIPDFVMLAEKHGFNGIGVGGHLVHIDNRSKRARWGYLNQR